MTATPPSLVADLKASAYGIIVNDYPPISRVNESAEVTLLELTTKEGSTPSSPSAPPP